MTKESKVNPEEVKEVLNELLGILAEKQKDSVNDAIKKYDEYKMTGEILNKAASKFASFVDKNFANPEENKKLDPNDWFPYNSSDELLKKQLDNVRSQPELLKELATGGALIFTDKLKEWLGVHDPKTLLKILLLMNFYLSNGELAPYQVIGVLSLPLAVELNNLISAENKTKEEETVKV